MEVRGKDMKMDHQKESGKYLMSTYARLPVAFVEGAGMRLWDSEGLEYLDFLAGIAVANLGHAHQEVAQAICDQAFTLVHTSNLYQIEPQIELARRLCGMSFADKAFFCNSGAEANEGAMKLARRWGHDYKNGASEIIAMEGSFHGRTLFTLSATGQPKFHKGFEPLVPGVTIVSYNDLDEVEKAISEKTAAVIVEPLQGEGGVIVPEKGYLKGLREICDRHEVLLIFDEVQTGMGRTGEMFAYQGEGVAPDIMTLAKALGNGVPIGAVLAKDKAARAFVPGTHAATFGGNFLSCKAATAVLDVFEKKDLLAHVKETGRYFRQKLEELQARHKCIKEVRGKGLLLGMELIVPGKEVVDRCMEEGMIINCTAEKVLRFAPPLIVTTEDIDKLIAVLDEALQALG
ncbi:MAG: acetylornithine transaminase [bacterium]